MRYICKKAHQAPHSPLMASMPPNRLNVQSPPFTVTGVDLLGPFLLTFGRNRSIKAWEPYFRVPRQEEIRQAVVALTEEKRELRCR